MNISAQIQQLEPRVLLSMSAPIVLAAGATVNDVQVADINGDGKSDVVELVGLGVAPTVTVQFGNGDGTFQAGITSAAPTSVELNVADYNHDGKLDIATDNVFSLGIMFGNGDGTFQLPVVYPVGANAADIKSADLNHDGFTDLVTSSGGYGGTSQVLLNDGTGVYPTTKNVSIPALGQHVEVGDLNDDGILDLLEVGIASTGFFLGQGDGTFRFSGEIASSFGTDAVISDFNHDGKSDIAITDGMATMGGGKLEVYLGDGTGSFVTPTSFVVTSGTPAAVADFNGDGKSDILTNLGQVAFGRGDGSFYDPTNYAPAGSRMVVADFNGDGSPDIVSTNGAAFTGARVSLNAQNDASVLAGAVELRISAPEVVAAGVSFPVTVSVVDVDGNVVPGFVGTVGVSGMAGSQAVSYTFTAADAGMRTITTATTLFASGQQTVTVTSAFLPDATATVTVTPAAVAKFALTAQPSAVAGQSATVTVTTTDAYGNPSTGYLGTVHFSSSDLQAGLPADYTFTAEDLGVHTFTTILKTAGAQTVRATDTLNSALNGQSAAINVTASVATSLSLTGGGGYIGSANPVTVIARDQYGNLATTYQGTVHLISSDPNTSVSTDSALVNGVGTFTATSVTLGARTLTAIDTSDDSVLGSERIVVTPGWAVRFTATSLSATVAGQPQSTTITAYDAFGNVSTVYTGTVVVSGTDPQAASAYTFTAADAGVHAIPIVLKTAGAQTVTISDAMNSSVFTSQTGIHVTAAAATSLSTTQLHGTTAGIAQLFTVTAKDAYGNIATGYRGTTTFSSSDAQIVMPAGYTFTAADGGTQTFSLTFRTSGGQSFTVNDAATPGFNNVQTDIPVTAGAAVGLSARAPANVTAGVPFSLTVSAVDAFGNQVSGYVGTIHFTGPSGAGNLLPVDYTFTAADKGAHVFSATLASTGTQSIGFADKATGSIKGSASVKVVAATTSGGGGGGGSATGSGGTATGGGGGGGGKKVVV